MAVTMSIRQALALAQMCLDVQIRRASDEPAWRGDLLAARRKLAELQQAERESAGVAAERAQPEAAGIESPGRGSVIFA